MRIRRIVFIVMVALAPVATALAGDQVATPEPRADASTPVLRPAQPVTRPASPTLPEHSSREKTLALLILMLREGRGAR